MNRLKKLLTLFICLITISTVGIIIESCHNAINEPNINNNDSNKFLTDFRQNSVSFFNTDVILKTSRGEDPFNPNVGPATPVYIELPEDESSENFGNIRTPGDMLNLVRDTGAKLSLTNNGTHNLVINMSDNDAYEALKPIILDCKKYLYGKGFAESDIQDMLIENMVDEVELIPFVVAMSEKEEYENMTLAHSDYKSYSFFAIEANANDIDWDLAKKCALRAAGLDFGIIYAQSATKTWSKAIIKRLFKATLTKVLGPVGVGLFIIEFSVCYWG